MESGQFTRMARRLLQMAGYTLITGMDRAAGITGITMIYVEINNKIVRGHETSVGFEIYRILPDGIYRYGRVLEPEQVVWAMERAARPLHEVQVWDPEIEQFIWVSRTYDALLAHREALECGRARVVIL